MDKLPLLVNLNLDILIMGHHGTCMDILGHNSLDEGLKRPNTMVRMG